MKIFYNPDSNYLEFFREHGVENYGDVDENDVMIFKAEEDDRIIGFGLEDATKNIKVLLSNLFEHERLPLLLKITRKIEHLTQEQLAEKLGVTLRQIQRIESGENTKLELVIKAKKVFPNTPFETILMNDSTLRSQNSTYYFGT